MRGRLELFAAVLAGVVVLTTGCSTVRPSASGHHGLFDGGSSSRGPAAMPRDERDGSEPSPQIMAAAQDLKLYWPLKRVQINSRFGKRTRDFHEGIDLKAKVGTSVYAAQAGRVIYAGNKIRGYGKMLVIKHAHGFATVYAHNSRLLVHKGEHVKLGQQISVSGNTGRSTGPHLHFEVRHGVSAVDPARLVPITRVAGADLDGNGGRKLASVGR